MFILVQLDISRAEMALFDDYEDRVLALLDQHGGILVERLRSTDGRSEVHLLHFADAGGLDTFRADPARMALQDLWSRCGATSILTEVHRLNHPPR